MSRAGPLALVSAGLLIVVAPGLTWFVSPLPQGDVTARGLSAAGELWTLPPLGFAVLAFGALLIRSADDSPGALWSAVGAALAGLLALGVAAAAVVGRPAALVIDEAGTEVVTGAPVEAVVVGPAVAFASASLALLAGAGLAWRARRSSR